MHSVRWRWLLAAGALTAGVVLPAQPARNAMVPAGAASSESDRRETGPLPPPLHEFRGVWVASVSNIDWPSRRTLSTAESQAELLALLDRAAALHLNAVILQVRPAADALYESKLEPWSEYLTGAQGRAPSPYWDPLAFAVKEAHARGLELHAWFNPYRARNDDARSPLAKSSFARKHASMTKTYGRALWMDPGEKFVRERTMAVIVDVVKRYDIDGVHIDDYFYPYRVNDRRGRTVDFPDLTSWRKYTKNGGTLSRDDWRRENVNLLVEALNVAIHKTKPWVKFGISPFGIWRPGNPEQVRGLDAYQELFADSRKWLREGWLDYFTPQLYWPTTKSEQAYGALLAWWAGENVQSRHLWPGNYTTRAGGDGRSAFTVSELIEQIRATRLQVGATGNVHFSMVSFMANQAHMNDSLLAGPYQQVALVPPSPWIKIPAPVTPQPTIAVANGDRELRLLPQGNKTPWLWLVRARVDSGWISVVLPGTRASWRIPGNSLPTTLAVTAINRAGEESDPISALPPAPDDNRNRARKP
ncbi:MAG: family 10 glycosylhydrolase [Gemmatimonadota bacterium]|nr:family 10 glycosylhydrolase [Gemmatimonadota bacterium]